VAQTFQRYDSKTLPVLRLGTVLSILADAVAQVFLTDAQAAGTDEIEADIPPAPEPDEYDRIETGNRDGTATPYFVALTLVTVLLSVWAGFCAL